jgi:hypothetical protein
MSAIDLAGGASVSSMTPSNTWEIGILAGYAASQASSSQDITSLESGLNPDRAQKRFTTSINPTEWSLSCYIRPTGLEQTSGTTKIHETGNSMPVADWFLWQSLLSNTYWSDGTSLTSAWKPDGKFELEEQAAAYRRHAHRPNFASASEGHLYFQIDNVIYQVSNATVNQASVDIAVDAIGLTQWSGFGTHLIELRDSPRDNAISVFGGVLNSGVRIASNSNAYASTASSSYHPWGTYNVAGVITEAKFLKNRLSTIELNYQANSYTFPITSASFTYNNNITYLTPETLSEVNRAIGQFVGARDISGSLTAYLRGGDASSSHLLRTIKEDNRTNHASTANANLQISGGSAEKFSLYMPAVQFSLPTTGIEDVITVSVDFRAQERTKGKGDELVIIASYDDTAIAAVDYLLVLENSTSTAQFQLSDETGVGFVLEHDPT